MTRSRSEALRHGLIAGLIGYVVFAVYFAIVNTIEGRSPLYTVNLLGMALFGIGDPSISTPQLGPVMAYNGLHLVAALLWGTIASVLVLEVDLHPSLWWVVMFLFIAGLLYSTVVGGIVARELAGAVTWAHVVTVNVLAALLSAGYLWLAHPSLRERVMRESD
jgi:hypothetical protein